jgi:membrane protein YdbS with pleckstrin-like domain
MAQEEIVYDAKIPWKAFHFSHGFIWLILFGWNFGLLYSFIQSLNWSLKITSERVVISEGIITSDEEVVEYYRVDDIGLTQTASQKLFNVGVITLYSDDSTAPNLSFRMTDPKKYSEPIREYVRNQRRVMGTMRRD